MVSEYQRWEPDPEWPPEVQSFAAKVGLYIYSLPPEERQPFMHELAIRLLTASLAEGDEAEGP